MFLGVEVFYFISDSQERYFTLGVFVGGGGVGNFYLSIGWNNLFLEALLVKIDAGVAIIQSPL